ncbi:MAG: ATP synthase F1 subunit gamma [Clostridium sp.]
MQSNNLLDIKRRINSIKSTQKITKAMELISISKLRSAKEIYEKNESYFLEMETLIKKIFYISRNEMSKLKEKREDGKKLFIVISSDSGLCGSFNGQGLDYIDKEHEKDDKEILWIGKRAISYIRKYKLVSYKNYERKDIEEKVKEIINECISLFKDEKFNEISLVYVKYISSIRQKVVEEKLLPFEYEEEEMDEVYSKNADKKTLLEEGIKRYLKMKFLQALLNSKVSEESLRMQAMNGAAKNADEMIKSLSITYNKIRQSNITREISEIVSGAEAQK